MSSRINFLLLLCVMAVTTNGQTKQPASLNIGDPAPPLRVSEWIKGTPVKTFEKGQLYVVEFWATWCKPCIAAMPHLSALANEYKDKVSILGINIYENKATSIEKVKAFVDSMGHRMNYHVAAEDSNFMVDGWIKTTGEQNSGIPRSFVVNEEGRLAWIGHPKDLGEVLSKMVNNTWDLKETLAKRNLDKYLQELNDSINLELHLYTGDEFKKDYFGKPDKALLIINEMVKIEPKLKYAPAIAFHTFASLLKTNPHKAYEYGKVAIVTESYEEPAFYAIIDIISYYSDKLSIPLEIYQLGAEACQAEIDHVPYPELVNMSKKYNRMAKWHWLAKNKIKAIESQQKAIELLKNKKEVSKADMEAFELQLQQYRK